MDYPKYDNFDAINVDKVADIPEDYDELMGVPVTFLDKYNPEQFEIIGNELDLNISKGRGYVNGKRMYGRIFIRRRKDLSTCLNNATEGNQRMVAEGVIEFRKRKID